MTLSTANAPSISPIIRLWFWITRPHPSITQIETRRQSRLLAGLTFALSLLSAMGGFLIGVVFNTAPGILPILLPAIGGTVVIYFINRSGRYQLAAAIFIGLNFAVIHLTPILTADISWLAYTVLALIITAILVPYRVTLMLFFLSFGTQILLAVVAFNRTWFSNIGLMTIFMITAPMVLLFMSHRSGLERERQTELRDANQRLRENEHLLEQRVKDRTAELIIAKEDAEQARHQAENADRAKSQFLASMSHELRTPLNAILTFNELMMMGTFGEVNEEQQDYLGKSLQSGRHLLSLINDVLDITKIHSGMMKLFYEADFVVDYELSLIQTTAEKMLHDKPVTFISNVPADLPALTCDKRRIRQILLNLVSNAVKFTDEGSITLSAKKQGEMIVFAVADTGPGIPFDQQELIFEPFVQTEQGLKHAGGTGLGLPISKRLAQAHGGSLTVESILHQGSTFTVSIPIAPIHALGETEISE